MKLVNQLLENRDGILSFIYALTQDCDVAEELFQEVARVILEEADKGTEVQNFTAWVREIARRRVRDHYRKQTRQRRIEGTQESLEEIVCESFRENDDILEAGQLRLKHLRECLKQLSERCREVIQGFYHDRKSIREIAAKMAWKENSVKVALSRARKALADCIDQRLRTREATA